MIATKHQQDEILLILTEETGSQPWGMAFAYIVVHNEQFEYSAKSYV